MLKRELLSVSISPIKIDSYVHSTVVLSFFLHQKSHQKIIPKQTPQTPTPPSEKETILLRGIGNKYLRLNHLNSVENYVRIICTLSYVHASTSGLI